MVDLLRPYKVGYVFEAECLFSHTLDNVDHLIASGFRDPHPLSLDFSAGVAKHEEVYDIVSHFLESNFRGTRQVK